MLLVELTWNGSKTGNVGIEMVGAPVCLCIGDGNAVSSWLLWDRRGLETVCPMIERNCDQSLSIIT